MFHPDGPSFWELARQALSSTKGGYDRLAPKFDVTPFRTPDGVIAATLAAVDGPLDAALDLCTGTGVALPHLRRLCRRVVGVDFSSGMLDQARRRTAEAPEVELREGDVLDLPFVEEFDLVTCFGAFGHILRRDELRFVRQIRRALEPGGHFLFATSLRPPAGSPAWLLASGFNGAMRLRNALWRPPFVMYYLTFTWPECEALLSSQGFRVAVTSPGLAPPLQRVRIVSAVKR